MESLLTCAICAVNLNIYWDLAHFSHLCTRVWGTQSWLNNKHKPSDLSSFQNLWDTFVRVEHSIIQVAFLKKLLRFPICNRLIVICFTSWSVLWSSSVWTVHLQDCFDKFAVWSHSYQENEPRNEYHKEKNSFSQVQSKTFQDWFSKFSKKLKDSHRGKEIYTS